MDTRILAEYIVFAEDGHNDVVFKNFDRTSWDEPQGSEYISAVNQRISRWSMSRSKLCR